LKSAAKKYLSMYRQN